MCCVQGGLGQKEAKAGLSECHRPNWTGKKRIYGWISDRENLQMGYRLRKRQKSIFMFWGSRICYSDNSINLK